MVTMYMSCCYGETDAVVAVFPWTLRSVLQHFALGVFRVFFMNEKQILHIFLLSKSKEYRV